MGARAIPESTAPIARPSGTLPSLGPGTGAALQQVGGQLAGVGRQLRALTTGLQGKRDTSEASSLASAAINALNAEAFRINTEVDPVKANEAFIQASLTIREQLENTSNNPDVAFAALARFDLANIKAATLVRAGAHKRTVGIIKGNFAATTENHLDAFEGATTDEERENIIATFDADLAGVKEAFTPEQRVEMREAFVRDATQRHADVLFINDELGTLVTGIRNGNFDALPPSNRRKILNDIDTRAKEIERVRDDLEKQLFDQGLAEGIDTAYNQSLLVATRRNVAQALFAEGRIDDKRLRILQGHINTAVAQERNPDPIGSAAAVAAVANALANNEPVVKVFNTQVRDTVSADVALNLASIVKGSRRQETSIATRGLASIVNAVQDDTGGFTIGHNVPPDVEIAFIGFMQAMLKEVADNPDTPVNDIAPKYFNALFKMRHATQFSANGSLPGTPQQSVKEIDAEIAAASTEIAALIPQLSRIGRKNAASERTRELQLLLHDLTEKRNLRIVMDDLNATITGQAP